MSTTRPCAALRIAFIATALSGCAALPEDTSSGQSAAAISGGTTDETHTGAVGIVIIAPDFSGTCSGTLITPNLVLTARHCVSRTTGDTVVCERYEDRDGAHAMTTSLPPFAPATFHVTTSTTIARGAQFSDVAEVLVPPGTTGASLCGTDIALLRLSQPLTGGTPMQPRLYAAPSPGERYTAVGYGITQPDGGDQGLRRMRSELTVGTVGMRAANGGIVLEADAEWTGSTGTCSGDSGGPAIDSVSRVFGVLSRGAAGSCDQPVYTRVDSWSNWLREKAQSSALVGRIAAPAWAIEPRPDGSVGQSPDADGANDVRGCSSAPARRNGGRDLALAVVAMLTTVAVGSRRKKRGLSLR